MTVDELLFEGTKTLKTASVEDADFDARCLLEEAMNIDTMHLMLMRGDEVEASVAEKFFKLIQKRAEGEPLQYILGKWEFCGLPFAVGKGVLIPRPETEMLVDFAVDFLKEKREPIVFDLCSGSGCIAISVASFCKNTKVYAVEKFDNAFAYLKKNILLNNIENITAVCGDIFDKNLLNEIKPDLILSNPPYIRSADIEPLQREVKKEPITALDGGEDGFDFYRVLCTDWFGRLKSGGAVAFECAEDQTEEISKMLSDFATKTEIYYDFNGLPRIVAAIKK